MSIKSAFQVHLASMLNYFNHDHGMGVATGSKGHSRRAPAAATIFCGPEMHRNTAAKDRPFYRRPSAGNRRASPFQMLLPLACLLVTAAGGYFLGSTRRPQEFIREGSRPEERSGISYLWDAEAASPGRSDEAPPELAFHKADLVELSGGTCLLGDTLDNISDARSEYVSLSPFKISRHEVTVGLWETVRLWGESHGYTDLPSGQGRLKTHPVSGVSWADAVKWCNAFSEMEGLTPCYYTEATRTRVARTGMADLSNNHVKWEADGYRLPTEAEWEFAARGGLEGLRFPWGNQITHENANYHSTGTDDYDRSTRTGPAQASGDVPPFTMTVGSFPANNFGLHDMAGNVAEWCWDFYSVRSESSPSMLTDPHGPDRGRTCVVRGGSWRHSAADARCANRFSMPGDLAAIHVGFRVARSR